MVVALDALMQSRVPRRGAPGYVRRTTLQAIGIIEIKIDALSEDDRRTQILTTFLMVIESTMKF